VNVVVETDDRIWSIKEGRPQRLKVFSSWAGGDGEVEWSRRESGCAEKERSSGLF
jgi:hypothetical protein